MTLGGASEKCLYSRSVVIPEVSCTCMCHSGMGLCSGHENHVVIRELSLGHALFFLCFSSANFNKRYAGGRKKNKSQGKKQEQFLLKTVYILHMRLRDSYKTLRIPWYTMYRVVHCTIMYIIMM